MKRNEIANRNFTVDSQEVKALKIDKMLSKSIDKTTISPEKPLVAKRAEYMSGFSIDREKIEFFK